MADQLPGQASQPDRAIGALTGLAIGDALGMPTQSMSRADIVGRFGGLVPGFVAAAPDHPLAHGLPAGSITDDTHQALIVADLLVEGRGHVDVALLAQRLLAWEDRMRAAGSLDLLGPSTKRALTDLLAGVPPTDTGRTGTTNGAAMRITPVGIIADASDPDALLDLVVEASAVTHNTSVALAGAAAVAAAVSRGVAGGTLPEAIEDAISCARLAAARGFWVAGADVGRRIEWAVELTAGRPVDEVMGLVANLIGTSLATQEAVPAAFALLAAVGDDPWLACRVAASVGGDTDTIAVMVGAIAGACAGVAAYPGSAVDELERVNGLGLADRARALLGLRPPAARQPSPRLVHLGNVVVDLMMDAPGFPAKGGDLIGSNPSVGVGGGFNVVAAAARQGARVTYAGRTGAGPLGSLARAALRQEGVVSASRPSDELDTGFVVGVVHPDADRTFLTAPGAEATLDDVPVRPRPGDIVYLTGYSLAHDRNRATLVDFLAGLPDDQVVVFDPGPLAGVLPSEALAKVLARADWLTCNGAEATALTGLADPAAAAQALDTDATGVIVRLGADGCLLATAGGEPVAVPAFVVQAVDTNGAGDVHAGVFIAALLAGATPLEAATRANAAAAISVTRRGGASAPTRAEVAEMLSTGSRSGFNGYQPSDRGRPR